MLARYALLAERGGQALWAIYAYALVMPMVVLASVWVFVTSILRMPRRVVDVGYWACGRLVLAVLRVRITAVEWRVPPESLPPQLVIVCNHESHLDSLLLCWILRHRSFRFIAKRQLFMFPLFGWALWASGNIAVSRGNTARDVRKLSDPKARRRDRDVLFFSEGTRSRHGTFGPFKKGAFAFAIKNGRPVLPVAVGGAYECLPPNELRPRPGDVAVVIGEPIAVEDMRMEDRNALRDRVRQEVGRLRQRALELVGSDRAEPTTSPLSGTETD